MIEKASKLIGFRFSEAFSTQTQTTQVCAKIQTSGVSMLFARDSSRRLLDDNEHTESGIGP